ncbi:hypothetical protein Tco_1002681 [Tanacetum coccineum]|uniref:Uncharacterized protein n=1 Tax=Tanacetum coccineum TaxID=301880 RepID=A0ABQ5F8F0_9ASTR
MNWLTLKFKNHWKLSSATKNALWNFWEKGYDNDKLDYDEESSDDECNNGDHRPLFDHHQNDNNKGDENNQMERRDHSNRPENFVQNDAPQSSNDKPNEGMCRMDKFKVIKYSVGDNEEFLEVRALEHNSWAQNVNGVSSIYLDIFRKKDEGHINTLVAQTLKMENHSSKPPGKFPRSNSFPILFNFWSLQETVLIWTFWINVSLCQSIALDLPVGRGGVGEFSGRTDLVMAWVGVCGSGGRGLGERLKTSPQERKPARGAVTKVTRRRKKEKKQGRKRVGRDKRKKKKQQSRSQEVLVEGNLRNIRHSKRAERDSEEREQTKGRKKKQYARA